MQFTFACTFRRRRRLDNIWKWFFKCTLADCMATLFALEPNMTPFFTAHIVPCTRCIFYPVLLHCTLCSTKRQKAGGSGQWPMQLLRFFSMCNCACACQRHNLKIFDHTGYNQSSRILYRLAKKGWHWRSVPFIANLHTRRNHNPQSTCQQPATESECLCHLEAHARRPLFFMSLNHTVVCRSALLILHHTKVHFHRGTYTSEANARATENSKCPTHVHWKWMPLLLGGTR